MSTATPVQITLPIGRLLWGNPYEPRTKDKDGKPLTIKNGPDAGKPRVSYDIGYGIEKKGERAWWETPWGLAIYQAAQASNPNAVAMAVAELQAGREPGKFFAFKIVDGDSKVPNEAGRIPSDREDNRGHWILSLGSAYAPRIVTADGSAAIVEPGVVKTGYYIQAAINVRGNDSSQSPGVYLNHSYIAFSGFGKEISNGPDPRTLGFGANTPIPAGMSPVPVGGMIAPPAAGPGAAPGLPLPPGVPAASAALPAPPGAPVAAMPAPVAVVPSATILLPQVAPPPPVAAPAAPAPVVPVMTAKAAGATYAQFKGQGWTDDQMRQQGYIV